MMALIGISNKIERPTPMIPAVNPMIIVSALNTLEMSFLRAPTLRRIPISLVRSMTETYVMMPIIIVETKREIAAKPVSTYVTVLSSVPVMDEIVSAISV